MTFPKLLVTGFSVFPGVPVNPTEMLARELERNPGDIAGRCDFRAAVLDVEYSTIGGQLARIAREFAPEIAIHFGLAADAKGFRIERFGRNAASDSQPDNTGATWTGALVPGGPERRQSTLPRAEIAAALKAAGLPVTLEDQAGAYLCNAVFYLSRSGTCGKFRPQMSGFIHVPQLPLEDGGIPGEGTRLSLGDLLHGARLAIATCVEHWQSGQMSE